MKFRLLFETQRPIHTGQYARALIANAFGRMSKSIIAADRLLAMGPATFAFWRIFNVSGMIAKRGVAAGNLDSRHSVSVRFLFVNWNGVVCRRAKERA